MAEYLTELSRLITNNKFRILNLEESDIISKSITDNHEKLLFKMDYWECRNILFKKYLKVLSQRFNWYILLLFICQ